MNIEELSELCGDVSLYRIGCMWRVDGMWRFKKYEGSGSTVPEAINALLQEVRSVAVADIEKWQDILERIDAAQEPKPKVELTEDQRAVVAHIRECIGLRRRDGDTVNWVEVPLEFACFDIVVGVPVRCLVESACITVHTDTGAYAYPFTR